MPVNDKKAFAEGLKAAQKHRAKKKLVDKRSQPGQPGQLNEKEARLLAKLRSLSEHQVYIVAELIDQLALEREISAEPTEQSTRYTKSPDFVYVNPILSL